MRFFIGLLFPILLSSSLHAQSSAHGALRAGEEFYDQKKYAEAENAYGEAPGDATAAYNAGNAAFQQGKFEAAIKHFQAAALSNTAPAMLAAVAGPER